MNYVSSIINKYGDNENVQKDLIIVKDILNRQGNRFLIDVIANGVGQSNLQHKYTNYEIKNIISSLTEELKEQILERV